MRYTYKIIVSSEHPETIIINKVDKLADSFTTIQSIEEVEDETPQNEQIIQEIPIIYV